MSSVDYEDYIQSCQDMGFDVDVDTFDFTESSNFYAYDEAGNRLSVGFDAMDEELSIDIDAAE